MRIVGLLIGAIVIVILASIIIFSDGKDESGVESDGEQGVFALKFKDYQGNEVSLADFAGTPLVVNS
tara:strand:+ start:638 stop:838 length:201 start_codon:yes stop_codon:yes gene_type:complete